MRFPEIERLSPNFAATPVHERRGVLFHHSVKSFDDTIAFMLSAASEVSYHVLIAPDGRRCTLVREEHIAWHAGASVFHGRNRCNDFLLGLAFAGDTYATPLTQEQLDSAREWLATRWQRLGWTAEWMTDHRQVTPGRKDDLNPAEWTRVRAMVETLP
jgi:AmpD protein